jgi:hypothetical protein
MLSIDSLLDSLQKEMKKWNHTRLELDDTINETIRISTNLIELEQEKLRLSFENSKTTQLWILPQKVYEFEDRIHEKIQAYSVRVNELKTFI